LNALAVRQDQPPFRVIPNFFLLLQGLILFKGKETDILKQSLASADKLTFQLWVDYRLLWLQADAWHAMALQLSTLALGSTGQAALQAAIFLEMQKEQTMAEPEASGFQRLKRLDPLFEREQGVAEFSATLFFWSFCVCRLELNIEKTAAQQVEEALSVVGPDIGALNTA
jgi:hypothetical protein